MRKLIILHLFFFFTITIFAQEKKVALIIGNGDYSEFFKPLRTSVNDAKAMDWSLQELGFKTIVGTNLDRDKMTSMLKEFQKEAKGADVAVFYYSGHGGYTTKQKYYLVPSGKYLNTSTLAAECYDFEAVERTMEATGAKLKLFFIDACRSPLDGSKGWVSFDPGQLLNKKDEARGTAWYFGTSETTAAFVGNGDFSVFTQALLNHADDSGFFNSVWTNITNEVVGQYKDQKPSKTVSSDFKDFRLNPLNYRLGSRIRKGQKLVTINTTPKNAEIKIDGKSYGSSIYLSFNSKYDIEISAEGYEPYKNTISVFPGYNSQTTFTYNLSKLEPTTLTISSNANDANVYVDGKYLGRTYQNLSTLTGTHQVMVKKKGYYEKTTTLNLKSGRNREYVELTRDYPWFWEESGSAHIVTYHYSPKYQIGLSYMYRDLADEKLSLGLMLSASTGLFAKLFDTSQYSTVTIDLSQKVDIDINGNGSDLSVEHKTEYIDTRELEYSDFVDPNHEAKHYDANALMLAKIGYSPCTGITLDLGLGAAYHQDKYFMESPYQIKKTYTINNITGEVSEPQFEYSKQGSQFMFKDKSKWSFAMRLGTMFFVPLGSDASLVLGGGYTYLPMNTKYSTWDASLGICWEF